MGGEQGKDKKYIAAESMPFEDGFKGKFCGYPGSFRVA